ncbi:hypothetical protein Bbelb_255720 [Branchiostoma belcheri]|nr:hypothetical protein Bbelb_255720 [Branchiostoma belcheri]
MYATSHGCDSQNRTHATQKLHMSQNRTHATQELHMSQTRTHATQKLHMSQTRTHATQKLHMSQTRPPATQKIHVSNLHSTCLQADLNTLQRWSSKMQMKFHPKKCKVMHLGRGNPEHEFTTREDETLQMLKVIQEEKDLGVTIDSHLEFSKHVQVQVNKANKFGREDLRRATEILDKNYMSSEPKRGRVPGSFAAHIKA